MAFRRPTLILCITTIVLGINVDINIKREGSRVDVVLQSIKLLPFVRKYIPGHGTIVFLKRSSSEVARKAKPVCTRIPELHSFLELLSEWCARKKSLQNPQCSLQTSQIGLLSPLYCDEDSSATVMISSRHVLNQYQERSFQVYLRKPSYSLCNHTSSHGTSGLWGITSGTPDASFLDNLDLSKRSDFFDGLLNATASNRSVSKYVSRALFAPEVASLGTRHESEEYEDIGSFLYLFPGPQDPRLTYFESLSSADDDSSGRSRKEVKERELSVISICVTVAMVGNRELRLAVLPILKALPCVSTPRQLIQVAIKGYNISKSKWQEAGKLESEMQTMSSLWRSDLPGLKSDLFNHRRYYQGAYAGRRQDSTTGWIYPLTSFLPSMGASATDSLAHLGSRLASLSSLPASCDISRVRLAEAGFYYDNSKTARDASNVHEVVCYSCGLTYGQWKKGDNPTTVHVSLRPDCEYLKSKNAQNSTPGRASSQPASANAPSLVSDGSSSLASSGGYMSDQSSSIISSGHGNIVRGSSLQQSSVYSTDSGIGSGSFNSRSDMSRNGGDLATDCSSIPPTRPLNQSASSGLARDSAASSRVDYPNSYSASRDTSRARALDLDDRPPLDMNSAVYPQFCRHQERRATFSTWPLSDLFRPDDLVMQGFYFAGYADCLRCFYCGVGLKSWAEDDDVMLEHIRWRPSCGYVLNTKGRQFVDSVLNSLGNSNSNGEQNNGSSRDLENRTPQPNPAPISTSPSTNAPPTQNTTTEAPTTVRSVNGSASANATASSVSATASQLSAAATPSGGNASREVLKKVEDMGFSKNKIARAVRHFQQAGMTKISADALVEKIIELDSDDSSDATATNSAQRDSLQTDGPEGASNYDLDADIQRAQGIISENERLKARQKCKICKQAQVGMIFLPCGHILACTQCGPKTRNCTHCGEFIRATANVYLS